MQTKSFVNTQSQTSHEQHRGIRKTHSHLRHRAEPSAITGEPPLNKTMLDMKTAGIISVKDESAREFSVKMPKIAFKNMN